jgi:7,8-dihydro-6-hydroxymethylpterin-pyrophosphokinase
MPVITLILLYTIANAIVCGTLSIPNPRYQTRVFWLIPLVIMMSMLLVWLKKNKKEGIKN